MSGAPELVIRRVIAVPREEVFDAWLDPGTLARIMLPGTTTAATAQVDARVGGRFQIVMMHGVERFVHRGEYLVIDRPSRLSFTWISKVTDNRQSIVTIEFHDRGGSTELILTHRDLPPANVDKHRAGWGGILEKLDIALRTP
ncbi:MAG TPA: SRPBCC domain-containing protein [Thermoanaerobaculia bacterium]|nr:SRPBCC domain-containing protein [Thermoanaerobaculia bacterium]